MNDDGTSNTVYPTYRELAEKYGVAPSVIADYAKSHNTMHRRKYGEHRIEARRDEKIIEARATAEAITVAEMLALIDEFLIKFREALKEGRVRTDSPADVNTLIRLKSFLEGGADSRQEIRHMLSLEVLSERHERYMRDLESSTPAMAGIIDVRGEAVETEHAKANGLGGVRLPPSRSIRDGAAEPNLSQHLRDEVRRFARREIADLVDSREPVLLAGIVTDPRVVNGQRGRVVIFKLDDGSEAVEAVAQDEVFEERRDLMAEDTLLIVQGKVQPDRFSGGLRLNITQVWDLAAARARFGRYLSVAINGLNGHAPPVHDVLHLWPAKRVESEHGELAQGLLVRLKLQRAEATAEIDLGDDARFWPCDEALGRWRSIASGGVAQIVYE